MQFDRLTGCFAASPPTSTTSASSSSRLCWSHFLPPSPTALPSSVQPHLGASANSDWLTRLRHGNRPKHPELRVSTHQARPALSQRSPQSCWPLVSLSHDLRRSAFSSCSYLAWITSPYRSRRPLILFKSDEWPRVARAVVSLFQGTPSVFAASKGGIYQWWMCFLLSESGGPSHLAQGGKRFALLTMSADRAVSNFGIRLSRSL